MTVVARLMALGALVSVGVGETPSSEHRFLRGLPEKERKLQGVATISVVANEGPYLPPICDTFDRPNSDKGLGPDWSTGAALSLVNETVHRTDLGWQFSTYHEHSAPLSAFDPFIASLRVSQFEPGPAGTAGVVLGIGLGGHIMGPAVALVADPVADRMYAVCSYASGDRLWGNGIVELVLDDDTTSKDGHEQTSVHAALGSEFSLLLEQTPTVQLTATNIKSGPLTGRRVTFDCGPFPLSEGLGRKAGFGLFGQHSSFFIGVDNFAATGCTRSSCEETCEGAFSSSGYYLRTTVSQTTTNGEAEELCVEWCMPQWTKHLVRNMGLGSDICARCDYAKE